MTGFSTGGGEYTNSASIVCELNMQFYFVLPEYQLSKYASVSSTSSNNDYHNEK